MTATDPAHGRDVAGQIVPGDEQWLSPQPGLVCHYSTCSQTLLIRHGTVMSMTR